MKMVRKAKNKHFDKAFTMVEIIMVIMIIAVLSVATFVGYRGISRRAISAVIMSDLKNSAGALKLYNARYGAYPNSLDASNCPNSPKSDLNDCVVASEGNTITYQGSKLKFILTEINTATGILYYITNDSDSPIAISDSNLSSTIVSDGGPSCALDELNQLKCWSHGIGLNTFSVPSSPTSIYTPEALTTPAYLENKTVKEITVTSASGCTIASDGLAYCWGRNNNYELGINNDTYSKSVPVPVNSSGVLSGKKLKSITGGWNHTCAIADDDQAYCWGDEFFGNLGYGSIYGNTKVPVAVKTNGALSGKTIKKLSAGNEYTCAIASDDQVYCWGYNFYGSLGLGTDTANHYEPMAVKTDGALSGKSFKLLSSGASQVCVVSTDDNIYCWGNFNTEPTAVDMTNLSGKTIKDISAGEGANCVITSDNLVYCWGSNGSGQLGNGTTTDSAVPVLVDMSGVMSGGQIFTELALGYGFSCVLSSTGNMYCWGTNYIGQFGDGTNNDSNVPVLSAQTGALSGKAVKHISASYEQVCAIGSDDNAYCWGEGFAGNLGDNTNEDSNVPVKVYNELSYKNETIKAFSAYSSIQSGDGSVCALTSSNKMYCWGENEAFPFRYRNEYITIPKEVSMTGDLSGKYVKSMASKFGYKMGCLIASDDNVYCWGSQSSGQLGNGIDNSDSDYNQHIPVAVDRSGVLNGKSIKKVSIGYQFACALSSDGKVYCWGNDTYGQLGNGLNTNSSVPVAVDDSGELAGKTVTDIELGADNACALTSDKKMYCWGYNKYGQLGDGTTNNSNVPVAVDLSNVAYGQIRNMSLGDGFVCAVSTISKAYCWGSGLRSTLGSPFDVSINKTPIDISDRGKLSGHLISGISASDTGACALMADGEYFCWGNPGWAM